MIYIRPGAVDIDKPSAIFDNLFDQGTLTGNSAAGFPVANIITGSTWDHWRPPLSGDKRAQVVLSGQRYADCLFIAAHDLGSQGARFRLQRSIDGGSSWIDVFTWIDPVDNSAIKVIFERVEGDAWRIEQTNGTASIGVVILGERLVFPYGIDSSYTSFQHSHTIEVMGGNSLGGQFLGQKIMRKGGNTSLSFPLLESEWVDSTMVPFERHYNEGKPFGFSTNPSFRDIDVAYCWRPDNASELRPTYYEGGKFQDMQMEVDYYAQ